MKGKLRHVNMYILNYMFFIKTVFKLIAWGVAAILTHWGRVTHICVSKQSIIGSDNGLAPGRRQSIIWTNIAILFNGTLWTNFSEILIEIYTFSFKKMHLKKSSGIWRPFCLGLNVLTETTETWHFLFLADQSFTGIVFGAKSSHELMLPFHELNLQLHVWTHLSKNSFEIHILAIQTGSMCDEICRKYTYYDTLRARTTLPEWTSMTRISQNLAKGNPMKFVVIMTS